jgi:hypothetical protein
VRRASERATSGRGGELQRRLGRHVR